jgi:ribonucleoside-diphosphate reductase alpha chain
MGFADMLIRLGVPYNSEEGERKAKEILSFILKEAAEASCELAQERGVFPNFEKSVYNVPNGPRLRNGTLTTIAPTGTLSIIAGCSSGIEPLFAVSFIRTVMDKDALPETNPIFEEMAKEKGFYTVELMKLIAQKGSIQEIPEIPDEVKEVFVTSHDISPEWHTRMQGAFQEYTHNAVSKTVNFPNKATEADVREVYMLAFKLGCKGVTIYRDGSREEQVLSTQKKLEKKKQAERKIQPRPRPVVTRGTTMKVATGCGNLYVTINEDNDGLPFEVFMQMGKAGGCAMSQLEAIGRLLSLALRSGINISSVIEQLRGIRCPSPSWEKGGRIFSCSDAIARAIEKQLVKTKAENDPPSNPGPELKSDSSGSGPTTRLKLGNVVGVCPDCGGALRHEEGCMKCYSCGYSKCG